MSPPLRHSSRRIEDKTSTFLGVFRKRNSGRQAWGAVIKIDGQQESLGFWATEQEAGEAYDRAALRYLGPSARRNFPERRLPAADAAALKDEAWRRFKRETASRYRGVFPLRRRWQARVSHDGKHEPLGGWRTQHEAAEAYDRGARFFFGDQAQLNFPGRRLPPLSPAAIRRLSRLARKTRTETSKYVGVYFTARHPTRPWTAEMTPVGKKRRLLGTWTSELDAARAHDRAARFYLGARAELNLPHEDLEPANAVTLTTEARREVKAACTSEYVGVCWNKRSAAWRALTRHRGVSFHLGEFKRERDAAHAYDAKSIQLRGDFAQVNFHPETGKRVWGKRLIDLLREDHRS